MTAYRYTRLTCTGSNSGLLDILAQEIEFRGTLGGADLTSAGLAATRASGSPGVYSGAEGPDKAFNDNTGDWWQPRGIGSYIIWDHGAGTPQHVEQVRWIAHGSYLDRTPTGFEIDGSNDLSTWVRDWEPVSAGAWGSADRLFNRTAPDARVYRVYSEGLEVVSSGVSPNALIYSVGMEIIRSVSTGPAYANIHSIGLEIVRSLDDAVIDDRRMSLM